MNIDVVYGESWHKALKYTFTVIDFHLHFIYLWNTNVYTNVCQTLVFLLHVLSLGQIILQISVYITWSVRYRRVSCGAILSQNLKVHLHSTVTLLFGRWSASLFLFCVCVCVCVCFVITGQTVASPYQHKVWSRKQRRWQVLWELSWWTVPCSPQCSPCDESPTELKLSWQY